MTTLRRWTDVDDYFANLLLPPDTALESALETSAKADLPEHNVAPNPGKLLHLLARIHGARNILEIGTLGGYSTIWLARALPPGGRLVTLEAEPRHADVARANITRASLDGVVELREGPALETLPRLEEERYGPFDLFFIDADKPSNPHYLESLSISCLRNQKTTPAREWSCLDPSAGITQIRSPVAPYAEPLSRATPSSRWLFGCQASLSVGVG